MATRDAIDVALFLAAPTAEVLWERILIPEEVDSNERVRDEKLREVEHAMSRQEEDVLFQRFLFAALSTWFCSVEVLHRRRHFRLADVDWQ
jgi:hypothetical protein